MAKPKSASKRTKKTIAKPAAREARGAKKPAAKKAAAKKKAAPKTP